MRLPWRAPIPVRLRTGTFHKQILQNDTPDSDEQERELQVLLGADTHGRTVLPSWSLTSYTSQQISIK